MAQATDKSPERLPAGMMDRPPESADLRTLKIQRYASRSDLFPRLTALQKALNARHFAIFRLGGTGTPNKRKLTQELENWGPANSTNGALLLEAFGDQLIAHVEQSLLPVLWNGRDDSQTAEALDFAPFTLRLKGRMLPFSGIGFPVRPGSIGNGFVVFTAPYLDLTGEQILDAHGRAAQVMIDLLQLEERRAAPSEALSEREIACLQLAGDGCISEEIAEKLGLSVHTVNAYLGSATIKLNSVNRIQAIAKAIRLGFIG